MLLILPKASVGLLVGTRRTVLCLVLLATGTRMLWAR